MSLPSGPILVPDGPSLKQLSVGRGGGGVIPGNLAKYWSVYKRDRLAKG